MAIRSKGIRSRNNNLLVEEIERLVRFYLHMKFKYHRGKIRFTISWVESSLLLVGVFEVSRDNKVDIMHEHVAEEHINDLDAFSAALRFLTDETVARLELMAG